MNRGKNLNLKKMSLLSQTEYKLTEYAAETMVYYEKHKFIEITRKILVECALYRPLNPREWIAKNIKRIANEVYQDCLNAGDKGILKSLYLSTNFLYRIVIFGRPGSGRKTQAYNLVTTFGLILIDAEKLIYQYLRGDDEKPHDPIVRELQRAFYYDNYLAKSKAILSVIGRRILEKDCLNRGWVLINFTHTLQDFKDILEHFTISPNKLVYLKCSEHTCMCRLENMPCLGKPSQNHTYFDHEMRFFNQHENEILGYLSKRHETICINTEDRSENVKTVLINSIVKTPFVMGLKKNTSV